jgi:hypothetical protein
MLVVEWSRRHLLAAITSVACVTSPGTLGTLPPAFAAQSGSVSLLGDPAFAYELAYPTGWEPAPKPVKTHLLESILKGPLHKAQLGLTVDPVKIGSLEEFGTLEQVRLPERNARAPPAHPDVCSSWHLSGDRACAGSRGDAGRSTSGGAAPVHRRKGCVP